MNEQRLSEEIEKLLVARNLRHMETARAALAPGYYLRAARHLDVTDDPAEIRRADFIIVAVPTPVNAARQPDLSPLESASRIVGKHMKPGATVVFESNAPVGSSANNNGGRFTNARAMSTRCC